VKASILVAATDGVDTTIRCLQSIAQTLDERIAFEVVLVDDATTDATAQALAGVGGDFRVLRNDRAVGTRAAFAQAAIAACGETLIALRHDAIVAPGALQALLDELDDNPELLACRAKGSSPEAACLALRSSSLGARTPAEVELAFARAREQAVELPDAEVACDPLAQPTAPPPALRDIRGFGSFLATRLGPGAGEVLYCSSAQRACEDLTPTTAIALVGEELSAEAAAEIQLRTGLASSFAGRAATIGGTGAPLTILDRWNPGGFGRPPADFRVLAVVTAYNERDVIVQNVGRLLDGGIEVHVLDNWSTDGTLDLLEAVFGERVCCERFPAAGPSPTYDWAAILDRVEAITREHPADWAIHQDADEIRESPWPGVGLRDALYQVLCAGFNCVDHTVLNFRPIDDSFEDGADLEASFPWCEFPAHQSDFMQLKAWSAPGEAVGLALDGGHQVRFPARRIFPYKFLLRHYPIRSQRHGERKVLRERQSRWNPQERARGWHVHYDGYDHSSSFLWDRAGLLRFDDPAFMSEHLVARLSGVGLSPAQIHAHAQIQAARVSA
jgi:hypothetical protein